MGFTDFEKGLLDASASLANVEFKDNTCIVQWDFVAEYTSTLHISIDEDGEFYLTITSPEGTVLLDNENDSFSNIVALLRELDTSLLLPIAEQVDEDKCEQSLLS